MKANDKSMFLDSMDEEMYKCNKNKIYELVKRCDVPSQYNILRAVWSHRRKTTPDGNVYRHRSRICVDGCQQKEGIDYFETYSPVVMWSTLRLLFIIGIINGWKSRKVDYVQTFPQATLDDDGHVYMHLPAGFDVEGDRSKCVLKLEKNLYGLKQASFNWSEMLKSDIIELGYTPSKVDPCLYYKKKLYVQSMLMARSSGHLNGLESDRWFRGQTYQRTRSNH